LGGDELFQLFDAQLAVFIRHPHVRPTIGEVGGVVAAELDFDATFALQGDLRNFREDLGFDVRRDGLGEVTQGLFIDVEPDDRAGIAYPEPEGAGPVLVQDGRDGD
jgi:hypothetical protein